jgi:AraC-like DNA-binding protein
MEDKVNHQKYFGDFLNMNKANTDMESEAVNSLYNLISHEQDAKFERNQARLMFFIYAGFAVLIALIVFGAIVFSINKAKRRRLKEIIGYLEVTDKLLLKTERNKKEPNKKIAIPTETEHTILAKLKKFESSTKYTHKDMSLATLAAQLDVNTKYLSEIINKHYNDNFNTYINRLRINYIIEKLKNEPEYLNYKISYLAEESGFSSHSSFATVFIDLIGKEVTQKKA